MSCGDIFSNIGFIQEDEFPNELKEACLDYFTHAEGVDLTYLGQKAAGSYSLLCRDTRNGATIYRVDTGIRPSRFEKIEFCR